jgi:YHS domain-containing protein/phenylpyruvate tautomerase PptA (4-oxalocrotonate tautomerase family)
MRADIVARITRVLAEVQDDPQRLYQEAEAWVHIIEVPDGNLGAFGQIMSTANLVRLVVDPGYKAALTHRPAALPARETVIDPICGMTVQLTDSAITLEDDGVLYGFCSPGCRDVFVEQRRTTRSR